MAKPQRLATSLTGVETCLDWLLARCRPVRPLELSLDEAYGRVVADMPVLTQPVPARNIAIIDGWAFRANDIAGASAYSPVFLISEPVWAEAGQPLADGCDCVIDAGLVEHAGPTVQVIGEAVPGEGIRRAGEDIAAGQPLLVSGLQLTSIDLMRAQCAGIAHIPVRRPRVRIVNCPDPDGRSVTVRLIANLAGASGASVACADAAGRDVASIAATMTEEFDLLVMIGGTGGGHADASIEALRMRGDVFAHGIALKPGRTAAIGIVNSVPVVALPGAPDQALAVWWTLVLPALDRLSARQPRTAITLPLARKIASGIGVAEILLLQNRDNMWAPLATGDLTLDHLAQADAWLAVPQESEGYAPGTMVAAYALREHS